ncbi:unnamed protein product [Meloidogyne enterolobii]|uniref:Uncharacterized protein n=1 Tax=Meloidogyne enterolobii TaxID=390850 RepID=A0ACB0YZM8_MELEN
MYLVFSLSILRRIFEEDFLIIRYLNILFLIFYFIDVEVLKTKVSELATRKEMLDLFAQMNSRLDSISNNKISLLWQWFFGFLTVVALYFSIFKR